MLECKTKEYLKNLKVKIDLEEKYCFNLEEESFHRGYKNGQIDTLREVIQCLQAILANGAQEEENRVDSL
ncbi:MAG: hypothetical protein P4N41_00540 [Negativicutes bacterium]|nr:hypothetical protein [Negativicutes bacterium]